MYNSYRKNEKIEDNNKIFKYITGLNDEIIKQFENYSKIYSSIIELYRNYDISENVYEQVISIIKDATFNILQDEEKDNFLYSEGGEDKKNHF